MKLLHLSDLHVSVRDGFDRRTVLDPLLARVEKDRRDGLEPDAVVITGDLAFSGAAAEYDVVKPFLDDLAAAAKVPPERLFIVPGNHDVDRSRYRPSDIPAYPSMRALNAELENPDYRTDLFKGLGAYFGFIEAHYPHLAPLHGRLVPFATRIVADGGRPIGLVGLNSAWMCRRSPDERTIAIGEYQLRAAVDALSAQGACDLVVYACHHPPGWLMPEDRKILKSHLDDAVLLCGHLHEAEGGYYQEHAARFFMLQAGAAYLGTDSGTPCRYQHLSIDLGSRRLTVDFRAFHAERRIWTVDEGSGEDGRFTVAFRQPDPVAAESADPAPQATVPEAYCDWIAGACGSMEAEKLYGKGDAFPLRLPEIFIPLYADDPETVRGRPGRDEATAAMAEKQQPVDIEALIARYPAILIEGQAGSGKTTVLKHVACTLSGLDEAAPAPAEIKDHLPVVIFLKDIETFFRDPAGGPAAGREALAGYFDRKLDNLLSLEALEPWLAQGRVLFLVDGLDEIAPGRRDTMVETLANLVLRGRGNRIVLAGRPHGLEGAVLRRYGSRRVRIHALNPEQIRRFIEKWFAYLYPGPYGLGRKNAEAMIADIRIHPATHELTDNPLMLTAVCILYHDNKELPDQRAELYQKFVDNMLYRRFADDPQQVRDFLAALAFRMHTGRVRAVDRVMVLEVMQAFYSPQEDENEHAYHRRLEAIFDEMEPRCGLLRPDKGQFAFWHLTFQEFLAADHLRDNASDFVAAVEPHWSDEWYREVVELYIGALSLQNKQVANDVVLAGASGRDAPPFVRWRLAGQALVDIPANRRLQPSLEAVRRRLLEIVAAAAEPAALADAGEILGRLGDPRRDLRDFVPVEGGTYRFKERGKTKVSAFAIGKYPVTNGWYAEFMAAGGYEQVKYWSAEGRNWLNHTGARQPRHWDDRRWNGPNAPVVGVCWYEADAFCRWLTESRGDGVYCLPDEDQWEAAAAGREGRDYPWGEDWQDGICNTEESKIGRTSAVGIFRRSDTPEGVGDMAGNVWEWTRSDYHERKPREDFRFDPEIQVLWDQGVIGGDEKSRDELFKRWGEKSAQLPVLRGGSWSIARVIARCAVRYSYNPIVRGYNRGFRCART